MGHIDDKKIKDILYSFCSLKLSRKVVYIGYNDNSK
jgi:hypothetical protein